MWSLLQQPRPRPTRRHVLKNEAHGGPLGQEVEADGAPLAIRPQSSRRRLALVKMPWGSHSAWSRTSSEAGCVPIRFPGKHGGGLRPVSLISRLFHCPSAREGFLATLAGFSRVIPSGTGPEHRHKDRCEGLLVALCQPPAPTIGTNTRLGWSEDKAGCCEPPLGGQDSHLQSVTWLQKAQRQPPVFHSRQQWHPKRNHGD